MRFLPTVDCADRFVDKDEDLLNHEDGSDMLLRNIGKELSPYAGGIPQKRVDRI